MLQHSDPVPWGRTPQERFGSEVCREQTRVSCEEVSRWSSQLKTPRPGDGVKYTVLTSIEKAVQEDKITLLT